MRQATQHHIQPYRFCYCINRACEFPMQRIFKQTEFNLDHKEKCFKWIITPEHKDRLLNLQMENKGVREKEEMLFYSNPIESLIDFAERKMAIRQSLDGLFQQLRKDVCEFIDFCKAGKMKEFDRLQEDIQKVMNVVLPSLQKMATKKFPGHDFVESVQWDLNTKLYHPSIKELIFSDQELFDRDNLKSQILKIKKVISSFTDRLIMEKSLEGQLQTVKYSDMMKGEEFLRQPTPGQLAKIGQLCTWEESDIASTSQFDNILKCAICPFQHRYIKSKDVNSNEQIKVITRHLIAMHLPYVGYCYSQRMKTEKRQETTLEEIVYLMQSQSFSQLVIMDGANFKCVNMEVNPSKLHINFMGVPPKEGQSQCPWLFVSNPEQAAFYTIMLIQQVAEKLRKAVRTVNFKKQYFILMTKIIAMKGLSNVRIEEKVKSAKELKKTVSTGLMKQ